MGHNVKEYIHSYQVITSFYSPESFFKLYYCFQTFIYSIFFLSQKKKDNLNDHVGKTNKRMSSLVELYAGYIQMSEYYLCHRHHYIIIKSSLKLFFRICFYV